jgi:hypothetical protein
MTFDVLGMSIDFARVPSSDGSAAASMLPLISTIAKKWKKKATIP